MKAHWQYFKYVVRHKWYVFRAGFALGVSLRQLITHDWSKFLPREWFAYVAYFYGDKPTADDERRAMMLGLNIKTRAELKADFDNAWNHHQKCQPHHWQYWLLLTDSDDPRFRPLPMPERYIREMVADWMGAGRAITGRWEVESWFLANKDRYILDDSTRYRVTQLIQLAKQKGLCQQSER